MASWIVNNHPEQFTMEQFNCSHPVSEIIERLDDGTAKTKCMFCERVQTNKV